MARKKLPTSTQLPEQSSSQNKELFKKEAREEAERNILLKEQLSREQAERTRLIEEQRKRREESTKKVEEEVKRKTEEAKNKVIEEAVRKRLEEERIKKTEEMYRRKYEQEREKKEEEERMIDIEGAQEHMENESLHSLDNLLAGSDDEQSVDSGSINESEHSFLSDFHQKIHREKASRGKLDDLVDDALDSVFTENMITKLGKKDGVYLFGSRIMKTKVSTGEIIALVGNKSFTIYDYINKFERIELLKKKAMLCVPATMLMLGAQIA